MCSSLNASLYQDYKSVTAIITSAKDVQETAYTFQENGFFQARIRTQQTSGTPFIRIAVGGAAGGRVIYEAYGKTGMYTYLWSPIFSIRKGSIVYFTLTAGENITDGQYGVNFFL